MCPAGKGLLGKVEHHVIRYEEQGRGSLHAHIILWVQASDIDRVSNEITAAIPADYDETTQDFVLPPDSISKSLLNLVVSKMQHRCRKKGCMKGKDVCKYGFSMNPHTGKDASFHASNGRWEYFRPRYVDRNTVSYHPTVLLLWGAHCNIFRITATAWS